MKTYRLYLNVIIVIAFAMTMFFSCKTNLDEIKKIGISQNVPVGVTEHINLFYTDSGMVKANLISPKMLDFSNRNFAFNEFPDGVHLVLYDKEKDSTVITSNYAILYNSPSLIDLQGDVVIVRENNDTIFSDQLYYNTKSEWIFTNSPVSFRLDGDMGYGKGFDADVEFNNFEIIEMTGTRTVKDY